jgi:hypothetical protein
MSQVQEASEQRLEQLCVPLSRGCPLQATVSLGRYLVYSSPEPLLVYSSPEPAKACAEKR